MRPSDDWWFLTPDERLSEVASTLAAGVLRLHGRAAWTGCSGYADRQPFGRRETRVLPGRPSPQRLNHVPSQILT